MAVVHSRSGVWTVRGEVSKPGGCRFESCRPCTAISSELDDQDLVLRAQRSTHVEGLEIVAPLRKLGESGEQVGFRDPADVVEAARGERPLEELEIEQILVLPELMEQVVDHV